MKYKVLDLEVTATTSFGRKINALDPRSVITAVAWGSAGKAKVQYHKIAISQLCEPLCEDLREIDLLVGQNFKFDMLYLWGYKELQDFIKRGGQVWDTMLAEYLLTGQADSPRDLDTLARRYGANTKDDFVKEQIKGGVPVNEIDKDLLVEYAKHDVLNTEIVFRAQVKLAKEYGMMGLLRSHMRHLLAITEIEYNGLYLNTQIAEQKRAQMLDRITTVCQEMQEMVPDWWPKDKVTFNPGSTAHVSALVFGGTLNCKEQSKLDVKFKTGPRAGEFKTKLITVDLPVKGYNYTCYTMTAGGKKQVTEEVLSGLKKRPPILDHLLEHRKLNKILGTYYYSEDETKGLMLKVHPKNSTVHSEFQVAVTTTGRLSSSRPNAQNIPAEVMDMFTSRFDNGVIIELDFCLAPDTRLLDGDMVWRPISDYNVGDSILGFDEHKSTHRGRQFQMGTVLGKKRLIKDCIKIVTTEGAVICSKDHMWIASGGPLGNITNWKRADTLKVGYKLSKVMEVWDTPRNEETSWMGGFLDGEGYISNNSQIGVGQNYDGDNGLVLEKALSIFTKYMVNADNRICKKKRCWKVRPAGLRTGFQAVGIFQPLRLKAKLLRGLSTHTSIRSKRNRKATILEIINVGPQEVVALETTTKTFLAEGMLSHNCQLEVCVQAFLAQSDQMIEDITNGIDFHCLRLAYAIDETYGSVYKKVHEVCDKEYIKLRKEVAKPISFQKAYGAAPQTISDRHNIPLETVKKVFDKEDRRYPEINLYYQGLIQELDTNVFTTSNLLPIKDKNTGRMIYQEGEYQFMSRITSALGKRYLFKQYAVLTKTGKVFRYWKMPEIQNYPVQGLAADIMALMVGKVFRYLLDKREYCLMVGEVHDSLLLDCKKERKDLILSEVQTIMGNIEEEMEAMFKCKFNVPLTVEAKSGLSWRACK